jgi:two-component system, LytTR family, response regulator
MRQRAIIVDDESLWRLNLQSLCAKIADVEVVGEAETLLEAARLINSLNPDVVFLDIELGGGHSGFDLLPMLKVQPRIVFVTSHTEYAIQAFAANALHYLIKPATREQLKQVISRLPAAEQLVLLKDGDRRKVARISDIVAIQAAGDYTQVHMRHAGSYMIHRTLKEWIATLPRESFAPLGRSLIVRCDALEGVTSDPSGRGHLLTLCDGPPLSVGKTALRAARLILDGGVHATK